MTLYMIGLGLYDMADITLRGLEAIRNCDVIYLEHYTAVLHTGKEELERFFKKPIILANREMVEVGGGNIVDQARDKDVAFLVVGDPFGATTHADLFLRARKKGVHIEVIHNASIMSAIGVVGLELYKYGKTTSIVFPDENWLPDAPYHAIKRNQEAGMHTLCLLDIKVAEPSKEDLLKGIDKPQPPRFMTVQQGLDVLKQLEEKHGLGVIGDDTIIVGVARLGGVNDIPLVRSGTIKQLMDVDFGEPMHSIIIPSPELHHVEEEMVEQWCAGEECVEEKEAKRKK
ncbi:diphthine synthase [Candidatus Woesearchaeota archaeon]|nr:diphthine synthase [Candidatus Woesearchaeota archaeon]